MVSHEHDEREAGNEPEHASRGEQFKEVGLDPAGIARSVRAAIEECRRAFYGGFCADDQGLFRPYSDRVYQRFWKKKLEIENPDVLAAILEEVGADTAIFRRWIEDEESEAKPRLKRGFAEAAADHVFVVPTFVADNEVFWGYDRMPWLIRKLDALSLRR